MIYKEIDNGMNKWIILIHCICGNEKIFLKQLRSLKKTHNIAMLRLPGHYIDSNLNEATFESVIEEIHKFVLEKGQKVDIMGVSLGAMIATDYIIKYGNDIENAYLIGNIYGFSIPMLKTAYMLLLKVNRIIPRSIYMYFITRAILPGEKQSYQRGKLYACSRRINKEFLYAWMKEMGSFIKNGKEKFIKTCQINVNVKLIYGSKDYMFLKWVTKRINSNNEGKLKIIKDAGHLCNLEQASKINEIIRKDNIIEG